MSDTKTKDGAPKLGAVAGSRPWLEYANRAGWWAVEIDGTKRRDVMEVRTHRRGSRLLYGRLTGERCWHIAHMLNGKVAGPFGSQTAARRFLSAFENMKVSR